MDSDFKTYNFRCGGNIAEMEIGSAYGASVKINRRFEIKNNAVLLRDTFGGKYKITERFVTKIPPEKQEGFIRIGGLIMPSPDKITQEFYSGHLGNETAVYLLDFYIDGDFEIEFKIIKRN